MESNLYIELILLNQNYLKNGTALERFENYKNQALTYTFPSHFTGKAPVIDNKYLISKERLDQEDLIYYKNHFESSFD